MRRRYLIAGALLLLLLSCSEKYVLDWKMAQLCKKDGGVKVFEQVVLPASEYDNLVAHHWRLDKGPGREDRLGPAYRYVTFYEIIKAGDPMKGQGRLSRYTEQVYRRSDGKLLGTFVNYGRAGGEMIVLGHWSTAHCPTGSRSFLDLIFIRGEEK